MNRFVRDSYELPATTDEQMRHLEAALRSAEVERARKIHGDADESAAEQPEGDAA